eukprot:2522694-Rhodomonas_salina.1
MQQGLCERTHTPLCLCGQGPPDRHSHSTLSLWVWVSGRRGRARRRCSSTSTSALTRASRPTRKLSPTHDLLLPLLPRRARRVRGRLTHARSTDKSARAKGREPSGEGGEGGGDRARAIPL